MIKIHYKQVLLPIILILVFANMLCILGFKNTNYSVNAVSLTSAKSMCVLEKETGKVLYSKDMNTMRANASTTKIATAITVIQNCDNLEEIITVNELAVGIEGTSIYLRKDEQLTVKDLLYGLMLRSGNDSACALAYHVGGTIEDFVNLMNETAKKAGALNTNFMNPHGLDEPNHYTTAYDLAMITAYALNNPIFKEIVSTKQYVIEETNVSETRYLTNKNKLLKSLDGCIGVKTGFTTKAGRCLVSAAERDGMTLICVVLNCGPMFEESAALLNKGFEEYTFSTVVDKDKVIYNEYYINNEKGQLNLKAMESYHLPISNVKVENIVIKYNLYEFNGDIDEGEEVGEINVFVDNHLQKTIKLYTINKIDVMNQQDLLNSIQFMWEENYEVK